MTDQRIILSKNYDSFRASSCDIPTEYLIKAFEFVRRKRECPRPISVHFDLTLRCNCKCKHCKQWTWPYQEELSLDQIKDVLTILKKWGVRTITLGGGEPLLHPHFSGVVVCAKENGFHVGVISNGSLMTEEIARAIIHNCEWIRFSVDGPKKDVHDYIRGLAIFDKVTASIKTLNFLRQGSSLSLGLNFVVQKNNILHAEKMLNLADSWDVDRLLFKVVHGSGEYNPSYEEWKSFAEWTAEQIAMKEDDRSNLVQLNSLFNYTYDLSELSQGFPVRSFYINRKVSCFAPLFFLTISSNGDAYPCDYLQYDTRVWDTSTNLLREKYKLGNVLVDADTIFSKLEMLFNKELHDYPKSRFQECGACTRFCQFNHQLTELFKLYESDKASFLDIIEKQNNSKDNRSYL
jgi:MoaA/NifB/PqqE/SkfB family radical SAM enzyme